MDLINEPCLGEKAAHTSPQVELAGWPRQSRRAASSHRQKGLPTWLCMSASLQGLMAEARLKGPVAGYQNLLWYSMKRPTGAAQGSRPAFPVDAEQNSCCDG